MLNKILLGLVLASVAFAQSFTDDELLQRGREKLDQEDCQSAVELLKQVKKSSDDSNQALGLAHGCLAGAPFSKVIDAVSTYRRGSLFALGRLANSMVPVSDAKAFENIWAAYTAFNQLSREDERSVFLVLTHLTRAAALIARKSGDQISIKRGDIAPASCLGSDCAAGGAGCDARAMSDSEAIAVGVSLLNAKTIASSSRTGILTDLAFDLGNAFGAPANVVNPDVNRCVVYNYLLAE